MSENRRPEGGGFFDSHCIYILNTFDWRKCSVIFVCLSFSHIPQSRTFRSLNIGTWWKVYPVAFWFRVSRRHGIEGRTDRWTSRSATLYVTSRPHNNFPNYRLHRRAHNPFSIGPSWRFRFLVPCWILNCLVILYFANQNYAVIFIWVSFMRWPRSLSEMTSTVMFYRGNPLQEKHAADGDWVSTVSVKNKTIRKLDGKYSIGLCVCATATREVDDADITVSSIPLWS